MIYLKSLSLLSSRDEHNILTGSDTRRIYNSSYPLNMFPQRQFDTVNFDNITIFYGGNGSGKTTLLNIISEKVHASRKTKIDKGNYFRLYVEDCTVEWNNKHCDDIKMISSDDIFDYLLDIRAINTNVNRKKENLSQEWLESKYNKITQNSLEDYEALKRSCDAKTKTMSHYVRDRLINNNIIEQSNGESALMYWQKEITENSIYILDEPENSLSSENQIRLKQFIEESARFYNCQFIISTHSPFLLSLKHAKIYDLDSIPVTTRKWSELPNVLTYYNFFKENEEEFKN